MKIIKDEKFINRNASIGNWLSFGALGVLAIGMYISFQRADLFVYSLASLVIGFAMTQIGMYFTNRYGRSPRIDEQLDAALKGLPNETSFYHYMTPAAHVLVGPGGVWVLQPYHQRGKIAYVKNRWKLSGGGFAQNYMRIFGQEDIGRPDLEIESQSNNLKKYLIKHGMEENELPTIQGALVFTSEEIEIDDADMPLPAIKVKQLKDFMRQKIKDQPIGPLALNRLKSVLPPEQEEA